MRPFHTPPVPAVWRSNNYDNCIRQADGVIDDVLAALNQKGYLAHSVIVITADHGEGLGEHGVWGHGNDLHAEGIDIPLIILDTDLAASRSVPYATQLDIAPTIADTVGIPIPAQWEPGRFKGSSGGPAAPNSNIFSTACTARSRFLSLRSDPAERINLMATADLAVLRFLRDTRVTKFSAALSPGER
jgi:hypothetical protein